MRAKRNSGLCLLAGVMAAGVVSAGVVSPVYFGDRVDVADSSDLNSQIATRKEGTLNVKYDTRAVSGAQNGNWSVSGGMLKFIGNGSNAEDLYLVNGGNNAYQNMNPELAGTLYRISATLVTSSSSGDAVDSIGISLHDNIGGTEALLVRQIRARSQIDVVPDGSQTRYDNWSNDATNRIDITVDERTSPFTYDVQVNGTVIQTGTVSFADTDRFVFFNLTDANGDMTALIDNVSVGHYIPDPWTAGDEVLFHDDISVADSADLNADIANRSSGTYALKFLPNQDLTQTSRWAVANGQLAYTGAGTTAANLHLVTQSGGVYQNFSALIGKKYWVAASLTCPATDAVDSVGLVVDDNIAEPTVIVMKKIKFASQIDVDPNTQASTRYTPATAEKYYCVIEVDETVSPPTYNAMVNGVSLETGTLSFASSTERRIYFRMYDHNSDGNLNAMIDDVSIVEHVPVLPDAFDVIPVNNLIANGEFTQTTNQVGAVPSNLLGSYGDFVAFENRTIEVPGWQPYHHDPSNLVSMIGTEHLVTGDSGVLNGTSYLDTLYNNNIVLNSSTAYRNGVVQSNILDGVAINPNMDYSFLVDVKGRG